jgi:putative intracellular protease/amidase
VEGRFVPCVAPGFNCWLDVCAASPVAAFKSARLIKGAEEIYYPGGPHGLTATHQDEVNADLLKFVKSVQQTRKAAA